MGSVNADRLQASRKDKNQNIQVFVRLRPLNARERDIKSIGIVEVSGTKDVIVKQPLSDNKLTKKFSFDKAFGPNSKQVDVYHDVVSPLIEEVLAGYNCTVFAYGQTGTGKTHTMVGESSGNGDVPWQNDPMSGIIPRSLSQLFDELRITNSEYTVRVSYLELYNEELFDLLSSSEDNSKLRIYEDVTKKGANIVNGLEEMTVYNKNEVYKIMAKGQEKRRMASTLMNAQSSRSHTVFTIVVHMKENSPDGEELMKIGKLNLVDLAGSENISKAGSDNPARKERARECVNINQSLLTLGRVITALVERHPHIPYRESKLTRLLQESLGGRTKTSIIATISPGHRDIEETLSTLEYAYRARNIQNKPEINQKMTKRAVLKEYSEEIDRLKRDLQASRERNGVYLANETYAEMTLKIEEQDKEIQEQILHIKAMKEEKDRIESLFTENSNRLNLVENELDITNQTLNQTKTVLKDKKQELKKVCNEVEEQKFIVSKQVETEKTLSEQAKSLIDVADCATVDINLLHNTVEKKKLLESNNLNTTKSFNDKSQTHRKNIKDNLISFYDNYMEDLCSLQDNIDERHTICMENQLKSEQLINEMFNQIQETVSLTKCTKDNYTSRACNNTTENFDVIKKNAALENSNIHSKLNDLVTLLMKLNDVRQKEKDLSNTMKTQLEYWKTSSTAKIVSLVHASNEWWNSTDAHLKYIAEQRNINHDNDLENCQRLSNLRKHQEKEISDDLNNLKSIISNLETKLLEQSNERSVMETQQCENLSKTHISFRDMLQTANADLNSKMLDTNNIIAAFEDTNKIFTNDLSSVVENFSENIDLGGNVLHEIKVSVEDVNESSKKNWIEFVNNTEIALKNVNEVQTAVIEEQYVHYNDFLSKCQAKQDEILQPINLTIKKTSEQKEDDNQNMNNLKHSMNTFKEKLHEDLIVNDDIEIKFLNEEYKLYSPTGKTPVRKEYRYPKYLASTSPHDRLLMRFKNSKAQSPESDSIIELDQSAESTPHKTIEISQNNSKSLLDDSVTLFVEPKPVKLSPSQNLITKSCSESDIYNSGNDKQCKENLNNSANDKKEYVSRLKQPSSNKKVLANKNS